MTTPQNLNTNIDPHHLLKKQNYSLNQYRSLRTYLVVCFSGLIVIIGALAALGVYHSTRKEARSLQNHNLEAIAQLIADRHQGLSAAYTDGPELSEPSASTTTHKNQQSSQYSEKVSESQEAQIVIQPVNFVPPISNSNWLQIPTTIANGLSTIESHGEEWQVLVSTTAAGQRFVVGQRSEVRDELAENTSLRMLIPLVVLLPILILVITLVIRQAFKPIAQLARHIDQQRNGVALPLNDFKIPREILPFAYSINQLLARLSNSMAQQRRFIADAAHELRTPLTALTLQAENLQRAELSAEDAERVHQLRLGLSRSQNLLEQLLSLARQQSGMVGVIERISLVAALKEVVVDFIPLATQKNIDLGVINQEDIWVHAATQDMQTLLRNAISNAIRYTPINGRVDIRIYAAGQLAVIEIIDSGAGMPEAELARVFDPFYRVLGQVETGSGLGLTIIQEITERYNGQVTLRNLKEQRGFCFEFRMRIS